MKNKKVKIDIEGELCGKRISNAGIPEGSLLMVCIKNLKELIVESVKNIAKRDHPILLPLKNKIIEIGNSNKGNKNKKTLKSKFEIPSSNIKLNNSNWL